MEIFYNFEAFASFFYAVFPSSPRTDRNPAQRNAAPGFSLSKKLPKSLRL